MRSSGVLAMIVLTRSESLADLKITTFQNGRDFALPPSWKDELHRVADQCARVIWLDGRSITSRETDGAMITIGLVDGLAVKHSLPWLHELYTGHFLKLAQSHARRPLRPSPDDRSAVNINVLGDGDCYERHVDTNHLTGLLFVDSIAPHAGGQLIFEVAPTPLRISPKEGQLLFFDAREIVHRVSKLNSPKARLSIVMNYYFADERIGRPDDLDRYLYGDRSSDPFAAEP